MAAIVSSCRKGPFTPCRYCRRKRNLHPNIIKGHASPTILWRRAQGRECAHCPPAIKSSDRYRNLSKGELEELLEDPDEFAEYMVFLKNWENTRNSTQGRRKPRLTARTSASAKVGHSLLMRKRLGFFWPLQLFFDHHGYWPDKSFKFHTTKEGRKSLKGVIVDETYGTPIGVTELFEDHTAGVEKVTDLGNSDDMTLDDINDAYKEGSMRLSFKRGREVGDKDSEKAKQPNLILPRNAERRGADAEDAHIFDELRGIALVKVAKQMNTKAATVTTIEMTTTTTIMSQSRTQNLLRL